MSWLRLPFRITVITVLMAVTAWLIPTPYTLRAPGHADDLASIVRIPGGHPSAAGRLLMTTIIREKANLLFTFYAMFDSQSMLVPPEDDPIGVSPLPSGVHPPLFESPEEVMAHSKDVAKVVALRRLGYDIRVESTGMRIIGFLSDVPATSFLRVDDVIDRIDGVRVRSVAQLRRVVVAKRPSDAVTVEYRRGGETRTARFPLISHGGRPMLGVLTQEALEHGTLPVDIDIVTRNVNGASAGLMFTLGIIDQLSSGGLARGRTIAGTGTIELDGKVGPIEGADLKIIAAARAGASVFLVPLDNYAEVRDRVSGVRVIPVRSVDDAMAALKALP